MPLDDHPLPFTITPLFGTDALDFGPLRPLSFQEGYVPPPKTPEEERRDRLTKEIGALGGSSLAELLASLRWLRDIGVANADQSADAISKAGSLLKRATKVHGWYGETSLLRLYESLCGAAYPDDFLTKTVFWLAKEKIIDDVPPVKDPSVLGRVADAIARLAGAGSSPSAIGQPAARGQRGRLRGGPRRRTPMEYITLLTQHKRDDPGLSLTAAAKAIEVATTTLTRLYNRPDPNNVFKAWWDGATPTGTVVERIANANPQRSKRIAGEKKRQEVAGDEED